MVAIVHHTYDEPKEWNIGGYPYAHMFEHFNAVQIVEADGFELEQIIRLVQNLPYIVGADKQVWTGDLARLVVQALL
jgi:hypothetical protein